ncbi:MAG: hypothetical protein AAB902_02625 [Patescibacteria group bacterium]
MDDNKEKLQKSVSSQGEDLQSLKERQHHNELIIMGITIVLFVALFTGIVAVGGMVVDGYRSKEASFTDLVNSINQQNTQIDLFLNEKSVSDNNLEAQIIQQRADIDTIIKGLQAKKIIQ